ncbi:YceI family protein [Desertivirga arenae]|uniref:YceI family protein n=1 Tax=Desertivirga arenae TaxID=2810309 RepID=UPI001A96F2B7|nr:YceI family protein [Pedobacter sp. SYSU D00823]
MKIKALLILLLAITAFSFKKRRTEDVFKADTQKSSIEWIAGKVAGEHRGLVKLSNGSLIMDNTNLKGGSFTIDMKSMTVTDLKGSSAQNLLGHLRGEDFFAIEKFPASSFTITKVTQNAPDKATITGNLTIKGITNSISFPASLKKQKNGLTALARDVKVDRTKYDIRYRSKSFFGDIGDKAIDDEFILNINLVCRK